MYLASCGNSTLNSSASSSTTAASPSSSSISVSAGLLTVDITLPASFFEGKTQDEVISDAKEKGIDKVTANADGSFTYTISKEKQAELVDQMKQSLVESIDKVKTDSNNSFITDIAYDKDFNNFTISVDKTKYNQGTNQIYAGIDALGIAMTDMYFKLFEGIKSDDMYIVFTFQDASTKEVLKTIEYPKALKNN